MARELTVVFTASFTTKIKVEDGESVADALSEIDIPENATCEYNGESFQIESVKDGEAELDLDALDGPEEAE